MHQFNSCVLLIGLDSAKQLWEESANEYLYVSNENCWRECTIYLCIYISPNFALLHAEKLFCIKKIAWPSVLLCITTPTALLHYMITITCTQLYAHNSCVVETSVEENFTVSLQTSILQNYNYIRFVYEDLRLCSEMSYFWRIINVCYLQRCACIFQQLYMMILLYANNYNLYSIHTPHTFARS